MPPPPPPSKSYSLVLDTDSEEEEYRRTESDTEGVAGGLEATKEEDRPALPNAALLETLKRMRSASLSDYDADSSPRGSPRSSANDEDPRAAAVAAAVAARRAEMAAAANAAADEAAAELEKEELEEAEAAAKNKKKKKKSRAKNKRRRKGSRTMPLDDDDAKEDEHRIRSETSDIGDSNLGEKGEFSAGNTKLDIEQEDINEDVELTVTKAKAATEVDVDNIGIAEEDANAVKDIAMGTAESATDHEGSNNRNVAKEDEHRIRSGSNSSGSAAKDADMDEEDEEEKKSEEENGAVEATKSGTAAETKSDALRIPRPAGSGNASSSSSMFSKITNFVLGMPSPAENEEEENHSENGDDADGCDDDGDAAMPDAAEEATVEDVSCGKKKKRRKKRKKKKSSSGSASAPTAVAAAATIPSSPSSMRSVEDKHSVSFGSVSVREYRRAMGECVVPADGGWPLGLSDDLIREYEVKGGADGFEERKQTELRRRHEEVLMDRLKREWKRRKREKEREKEKQESKSRRRHNQKQRGGGGGGGRARKGSKTYKDSPDTTSGGKKHKHEEPPPKELLDAARAAAPAEGVYLETRQFDYRRRKSPDISNSKKSRHRSHSAGSSTDGAIELPTVEDVDDGKNPLFAASAEDERMHKIVHDRVAIHADADDDDGSDAMNHGASKTATDTATSDGGYDHVEVNHVKHELESIRSSRTGEGSTGCTCRKIHVFLPGRAEGKGHRRGSHRRMPERKVREELRRRGLLPDAKSKTGRDELEQLLHDAVEAEPCCWGGDCPCVRNGIGCQADTCSCWHPNHGADAHSKHHHAPTAAELNEVLEDVEGVKRRCGNANGMYVVDFARIEQGRRKFLTKSRKGDVAVSEEQEEKNVGTEKVAEMMLCQPVGNGSP